MTRAEIAAHVCEIVGTTDDESIALCKTFLDRRYRLVWDSHPWRETLRATSATSTVGFRDVVFTQGPEIERILVLCDNDESTMDPIEWVNLFAMDPAAFAAGGGTRMGFSILRHTALTSGSDYVLTKPVGQVQNQFGVTQNVVITLRGLNIAGERDTVTATIVDNTVVTLADAQGRGTRPLIEVWSAETSVSEWSADAEQIDILSGATPIGAFQEGRLIHPTYPQVRLGTVAATARTIRAIGKLRAPTMVDAESPTLPNIAEPLIGLVQADMLERQRQYSKAAAKRAEAGALVAGLLVDLQRRQSADGMQIIPDMEPAPYGPGVNSQKGYW